MQCAEFFLPQKIHPVVAPAAGDLDDQLLLAGTVMRPVIGHDDFFDEIDRIADVGMKFNYGKRGHRALLEATRRDDSKTPFDKDPSGSTPPKRWRAHGKSGGRRYAAKAGRPWQD